MVTTILFVVAAQVEGHPFWQSPLGVAIGWTGAIMVVVATFAAGVAGARALWKTGRDGQVWLRERQRRDEVLDLVLSKDGWSNGAKNIVEAHRDLYNRVATMDQKLDDIGKQLETLITDR